MTGIPNHGVNALSLPAAQLPKFMVVSEGYTNLIAGFESVLTKNYAPILPNSGGYLIYEKN